MNDKEIQQMIEQVGYSEFYRYYKEKDIRIEQLQSNWNSLREWLEKEYKKYDIGIKTYGQAQVEETLNKMNELERGEDENN